MFNIFEKKGQTIIQLTAGDSLEIETVPFIDTDDDNKFDISKNDEPIVLGENDYVLFVVYAQNGKVYIKKVLTANDYNEQDVLTMKISCADTKDLQPYKYFFSFSYLPQDGADCYTYNTGAFEVMPSINAVDLLNEYLHPTPPETDESENDNNAEDTNTENIGGDETNGS